VTLRNIRREANDKLDQLKKDGDISEDEHHQNRDKNDDAIHEYTSQVDALIEAKGKQIQTI
jgi:ribosome recycling factor